MALTTGQKCERMLELLRGIRIPRVAGALAAHGFGQPDLDEGWELLRLASGTRLNVPEVVPFKSDVYDQLDRLENVWFPICQASLDRKYPTVYNAVFLNLRQTSSLEVSLSMETFVARIRKLETSKQQTDKDARALLQRRGLTEAVISQAEALLSQLTTKPDTPPQIAPSAADMAEAEAAMWAWYTEWCVIARQAIHDRRLLRCLGFLTATSEFISNDESTEENLVDDDPPYIVDQREARSNGLGRVRSA